MIGVCLSFLLVTGSHVLAQQPWNRLRLYPFFQPLRPWQCRDGVVADVDRIFITGYVNLSNINFDISDGFLALTLLERDETVTMFPSESICIVYLDSGCHMRRREETCYCMGFRQDIAELAFNITLQLRYQYLHVGLMFVIDMSESDLMLSNPIELPYIYKNTNCIKISRAQSKGNVLTSHKPVTVGLVWLTSLVSVRSAVRQ